MTDSTGIAGKVAVVTGAAGGIGQAVARTLAARGASIAAWDIDRDGLDALVHRLSASGFAAAAYHADVRDSAVVEQTVARIEAELGPSEILVNVAGVLRAGATIAFADEDWEALFSVNATGVFYVSRALARRMVDRASGSIVTVGSNAAGVPRWQMAGYAASKAATAQFTKCLGLELAEHGIRCNVVSPGSTDTTLFRSLWGDEPLPGPVLEGSPREYRVGIPLQKLASPVDIAEAVTFLVSDQASHITMQDLYVDGGAGLRS